MKKYFTVFVLLLTLNVFTYSQTWRQRASLPNPGRSSGIGCAVNGKGYMGLGQNKDGLYLNDFWEYDSLKNEWTQKVIFPGPADLKPRHILSKIKFMFALVTQHPIRQ